MQKKAYMIAIFLLIVGGIAWGILALSGKNVVAKVLGKKAWIVYGLVGIAAVLVLLVGRNAFLPFLGPTVFPCAALEDKVPENADVNVEVLVKPGAKVLYWGAEPASDSLKGLKTWKDAYAGYNNVGVTTADDNGIALLRLRNPQPYEVPMKGRIESHVHYRMCHADGWMTQVETQMISSELAPLEPLAPSEAFVDVSVEPTQPEPQAPVIPVVAQSPEMPVIADPVSGLPTAVPADVLARPEKKADAETPSPVEGFSNEPIYSSSAPSEGSLGTLESEDPRLQRLRSTVEADALKVVDDMGYSPCGCGTDLEAAFQAPVKPASVVAWASRLQ